MSLMKRAVITGVKATQLVDTPVPKPKEDWVLIKVMAAPLCTEYKNWLSGSEYHGHEAAGEVVEVSRPGKVKVGDRVVVMPGSPCGKCALCISGEYIHCQNNHNPAHISGLPHGADTHVQYLIKQESLLVPIPEGISYERASLACCGLGPTFGAMENFGINAMDTVMITGGGPVGLGGVINARFRGARTIVVEQLPFRQEKAKELGADLVLDPMDPEINSRILEYTGSLGVDACLETSGTLQAQRLCIDVTRRRGQIALIGECSQDLAINASSDFIRNGICLSGQWHYNMNYIFGMMRVISNSPIAENLITHVFPMKLFQQAMEISASHACAKIILKPWED